MKVFRLAVAAAVSSFLVAGSPPAMGQDKAGKQDGKASRQDGKISKQDMNAMQKLAQSDMAEIETGKVAAQKATSPEVKKYAEKMVEDHSKMLEEGKKTAQDKGATPPSGPDKKHQAALKKLQGMSGAEFDRQYINQMVRDHQEALKVAEKAAKDAKDPDLKAHAEKGAPHIKQHLEEARKLQASLGSGKDSGKEKGGKSSAKQ